MAKVPNGRALRSTELGRVVCDFLVGHFPALFEVGFTARMEDQLDEIATGEAQWTAVMAAMWAPLSASLARAASAVASAPRVRVATAPPTTAPRRAPSKGKRGSSRARGKRPGAKAAVRPAAEPAGQACPECGKPLVQRTGKYGPFVGCSGFPTCRYIQRG